MRLPIARLESAIETLREEGSSPDQRLRALNRLRKPRNRARYPLVLAATGLLALIAVMVPRQSVGCSLSCVVSTSLKAPVVHETSFDRNGNLVSETWYDHGHFYRREFNSYQPIFVEKLDGSRHCVTDVTTLNSATNSFAAEACERVDRGIALAICIPSLAHANVLKDRNERLIQTQNGTLRVYDGRINNRPVSLVTDEATHHLENISSPEGREVFEYPSSFPGPVQPDGTGFQTFDLDHLRQDIAAKMKAGLGRSGRVELRLCALDMYGNLWSVWSTSDGSRPVGGRVMEYPGLSVAPLHREAPSDYRPLIANNRQVWRSFTPETRMVMMFRRPTCRVGDSVTISIPDGSSWRRFEHVPVLRVTSLADCGLVLDSTTLHG